MKGRGPSLRAWVAVYPEMANQLYGQKEVSLAMKLMTVCHK